MDVIGINFKVFVVMSSIFVFIISKQSTVKLIYMYQPSEYKYDYMHATFMCTCIFIAS